MRNKQEAINVIKNDAEIPYQYINHEGQTCAIGGLAKAAGLDLGFLLKDTRAAVAANEASILRGCVTSTIDGKPIRGLGNSHVTRIRKAIKRRFGFTDTELREIQRLNDMNASQRVRRINIIDYINTLEDEDGGS